MKKNCVINLECHWNCTSFPNTRLRGTLIHMRFECNLILYQCYMTGLKDLQQTRVKYRLKLELYVPECCV